MGGKLRAFFRWLTGINRRTDPVLERYLRKNREALERQRAEPSLTSFEDHEEEVEEVPENGLSDEPELEPVEVVEQLSKSPDPNQGALPIKLQEPGDTLPKQ